MFSHANVYIFYRYMNKVTDLIDFCATIHTKTLIPDVLIIDDFDYYVNQLQVKCYLLWLRISGFVNF